ncbi:MAG: glycosyltransferase family 4 protein [Planctomycetes bacterium]|nr:glycosyltransferase family 4 protein [Planctomycetota bacterium]
MRIEYVTEVDLARPDGPTTHVLGMVKALQQLGHEVTLLLPPLSGKIDSEFTLDPVPVPKLPKLMRPLYALTGARHAMTRLRRQPPDFIYCRVGHFTRPGPVLAKSLGLPMISELNGITEKHLSAANRHPLLCRYIISHEMECLRLSSRVICNTEELREHVLARDPELAPEKVLTIQNGVDTELFQPRDKLACRRELGIPVDAFVVGYLGTFEWWQGIEVLFNAFEKVVARIPTAFLALGGFRGGIDLNAEIAKRGLAGKAVALGEIPLWQASACISAFDLGVACVLPLGEEQKSFSTIKIFSYLACGRPVVASDLPGFEVIRDYAAGCLFPAGDEKTLAEKIIELAGAPAQCGTMGNSGRDAVEKHFTWLAVAKTSLAGFKT